MALPQEEEFIRLIEDLSSPEKRFLIRALRFAKKAHLDQQRISGEPYIVHPIEVAIRVYSKFRDIRMTAAALLHDVVEDNETIERRSIYETFGSSVGFMVDALTKNRLDFYALPFTPFEDKIERLLYAGMLDVRVLLLKLADRENNLMTLDRLKGHKQVRMAFETQAIFLPLQGLLNWSSSTVCKIDRVKRSFKEKCRRRGIKNPAQLKQFLYEQSFSDLSEQLYRLIYAHSDTIIWEVNEIEYYRELLAHQEFESKTEVISLETNGSNFMARFCFKTGGMIMPLGSHFQLKASSFQK